ncbi:hypothetical protein [Nocardioides caricicola]|uniref:M23 family metallopeptidase n=1 Tax=Nocardioides caricicola TaxID=634770 RepID=A0ABW0N5T8_9ACTN
MRTSPFAALAFTAALTLTACGSADSPGGGAAQPDPTPLSQGAAVQDGLDGTSMPPWPAPTDVPARVAAARLDLGPMGTAEHYHPQLSIVIGGTEVPVAANIGVDPSTGAMSALHTHDGDGTIHIEADTQGEVFTLGQLFTQWGVRLTRHQIGGVRAEPGQLVELTSNGSKVTGDPMDLRLEPDQQIVLSLR